MRKGQFLTLILTGLVLLSLAGCGKTTTEMDETSESFEAYYQSVSNDDIVFENKVCFVGSQILLTAADGVSQSQISELVKEQDGTVVGYISISNDYQIEFADGKTFEELDAIIGDWENNDSVEAVSLNYASQFGADSIVYTNDPWIDADNSSDTSGSEWSETASEGNNWWAEAIMMPSVWNMDAEFQTVKVGIYDTMFDTDNEDLTDIFAQVWNASEDENGNCVVTSLYSSAKQANQKTTNYAHGTHVAGLIAAKAENNFGIAGVSQNAQLYGFSYMATATDTEYASQWGDIFELKYSIALMLSEGVKVINFSIGMDELLVAAQHGVASALEALAVYSSSMEQFLLICLNSGYDFLIVKSAGNQNGYSWSTCETSNDHPYGYKQDDTIVDNIDYNAQYDFLGAIEDETVKAHILIVGAVENHTDYYTTAYFSAVGDRVDVYAPGVNILSDFPTNISKMDTGTSMATPIVSGIASLVWGANPDLSAVQVASIIRASSSVSMFDADSHSLLSSELVDCTPIVNAYFAVQLALNTSGEGNNTTSTAGIITGIAYTTEDDGSLTALSDATVTVMDSEGNTVEIAGTSNLSGYTFILPAGTYTITVELEGYETTSKETSLAKNDVLNVDFEMEMVPSVLNPEELYADAFNIWKDFLESGAYVDYTSDGWYALTHEYAIEDINNDNIPELLIETTTDAPFYNTWLFTIENGEIICVFETYGYGSFRYSPMYNAVIVSPEWKPFLGNGYLPFYQLEGTNFTLIFTIIKDEGDDYFSDSSGKTLITDDEYSAYYADAVNFSWEKAPSVSVVSSSKSDLSVYLGTNIYDFGKLFNGSVGESGSDGTMAYSKDGIYVAQGSGADSIDFIELDTECEYSICGVECGMSVEDATNIVLQTAISIEDDLAYYKSFQMSNNITLSIHAEDEQTVDCVTIYITY